MARAIKERFAQEELKEVTVQEKLRRRPPTGESLFNEFFPLGSPLQILARKTKAFFNTECLTLNSEVQHRLRWRDDLKLVESYARTWLRSPGTWSPKGKAPAAVFRSLISHLFCLYPVPTFLYNYWRAEGDTPGENGDTRILVRRIFCDLGKGESFAKNVAADKYGHNFPRLTKRQCHLFLCQPNDSRFVGAIRQAQAQSFGGSASVARELAASFVSFSRDEEFVSHAIQWFCNQGMFDVTQVRPMVDYIQHCRAAQNNWTLSGRTVHTVIQGMETWHRELQQKKKAGNASWEPSGIPEYIWTKASENEFPETWSCKELCTSKELHSEGKELRHCVSSYAPRAAQGMISIWSLRHDDKRCLTIEVQNAQRTIVQARGFANRRATPTEREHLRRWARQAGIRLFAEP